MKTSKPYPYMQIIIHHDSTSSTSCTGDHTMLVGALSKLPRYMQKKIKE